VHRCKVGIPSNSAKRSPQINRFRKFRYGIKNRTEAQIRLQDGMFKSAIREGMKWEKPSTRPPPCNTSIHWVSKANRGYKWRYKINFQNIKPSIYEGSKTSFNRRQPTTSFLKAKLYRLVFFCLLLRVCTGSIVVTAGRTI